MKLTIIERLHTEYLACWTVYDAAHGEARQIAAAASARIKNERERNETRIANLQTQASDPARSESVRRLARLEIEKLGAATYGPNEGEIEAFNEQISIALTAISDAEGIRDRSRELFSDAADELAQMRKVILGDERKILAPRWLEGCLKDFERLGGVNV